MTPFILFTGKGREEVVVEAFENGADAYLQKGGEPRSVFVEMEHRIGAIVQRHQAEAARLESESDFRTLFENSPDPIVLVGLDGKTQHQPGGCPHGDDVKRRDNWGKYLRFGCLQRE